jgi:N-acetylmuramoyl-L-alanine amidase
MMKVTIDAGHGKSTQGKRSPDSSLLEYKYCREIADLVVEQL